MNIAKDLGNLISGLFAPRELAQVQRLQQGGSSRSRTTTGEQGANREKTAGLQGDDRLTLSSESISLAQDSQKKATSVPTSASYAADHPSPQLALPYTPTGASSPPQQLQEESPATRYLVRATYGSSDSLNGSETFSPPTRIDFHA